jgi:hypothetical protein
VALRIKTAKIPEAIRKNADLLFLSTFPQGDRVDYIREEYKPCARNEHIWFDGTDPDWVPSYNMAGEVSICDRCEAVRRRSIDSNGKVVNPQYIYPDGYSMKRDERPSKAELRAEWYKVQKAQGRVNKDRKTIKPTKKTAAKKATTQKKGAKRGHLQSVG